MASGLVFQIILGMFCFCGSADGTRTKLFGAKKGLSAASNDGICKSVVVPRGYVCQEHSVITQDGYILSMQNIPHGRSGGITGNRPPVLLQHGLLMDAVTWLLSPPDQSLALLLADNGFDVWLTSTRGTRYSRGHTSLSTNDAAYWDWSWDELVAYDLPATFQYVNSQTRQKLHYVGHSLGTLTALASFSKGQLVSMLRSAALLSPIAYIGQMTSPVATNAADNFLAEVMKWLGIHEFNPRGNAVLNLLKDICAKPGVDCTNLLTSFTGQNCCLNTSAVSFFLEHEPQSSSTKNMIHVAQMIRDGTIQMYDYGNADNNNQHYGQRTPPAYDMSRIPKDLPLFFAYGGADALSDVKDVKLLYDSLKDDDGDKLVFQYREDYAHADYVMAVNAKEAVAKEVAARTKLYSDNEQNGICKLMVDTQGYLCEEHKVTTEDGYVLSMQRIPKGRSGETADRPPVLLQHGLLMDGITWLLNSPNESLAFILADNGYDVWIGNTRGTNYSRGHTSLTPDDSAYWDWSWDELVAYDLPATFQYVHEQTGQKLHYVGHSLGTLTAFASFSQDKMLNMLRSAALLSPIAYLGQMSSFLARSAADIFLAEELEWLGLNEFNPRGEAVAGLLEVICQNPNNNCSDLMTSFTGKNCCVNSSATDIFLQHEPQPTATKNMIHLSQMIRGGKIAMYDYGSTEENNKHYNQPTPPEYKMASIPANVPLFLSNGGQDLLSDVKDVQTLLDSLDDHDRDKLVVQFTADYAHADYVFAVNAKQVVYDPLMAFFKLH